MKKNRNLFLNYFRPNLFVETIDKIDIGYLRKIGIKAVFCDLDNTLVPHFTKFPTKKSINFCNSIQELGMKFIIVSNNNYKRVSVFSRMLGANDFVYKARKPFISKTKKMMLKHKLKPEEIIFIGDQFIFDIFLANRLKIRSILTLPIISDNEEKKNWFFSWLEEQIYKKIQHNNFSNEYHLELEEENEIL